MPRYVYTAGNLDQAIAKVFREHDGNIENTVAKIAALGASYILSQQGNDETGATETELIATTQAVNDFLGAYVRNVEKLKEK